MCNQQAQHAAGHEPGRKRQGGPLRTASSKGGAWSQSMSCCSDRDTTSPVYMALMHSAMAVVAKVQQHPHCRGAVSHCQSLAGMRSRTQLHSKAVPQLPAMAVVAKVQQRPHCGRAPSLSGTRNRTQHHSKAVPRLPASRQLRLDLEQVDTTTTVAQRACSSKEQPACPPLCSPHA